MGLKLTGLNPLSYMGVEPSSPSQFVTNSDDPTPSDWQNFNLGTEWLNTTTNTPWKLVSLQGNRAIWIKIGGSGTATETLTTDDAVVVPPTANNINISGGTGIATTGDAGTSTVTISLDPTAFTDNSLLLGSSTGGIVSLGTAGDGQIPIGSTGFAPVLSTITAGSGVTITNGAGSITIAATGGSGGQGGSFFICWPFFATSGNAIGTYYTPLYTGGIFPSADRAVGNTSIPIAGTVSNLYANIGLNGTTTPVVLTVYKNGVNTGLTVTIPAGTTGVFTDLVDSFTVAVGDTIGLQTVISAMDVIGLTANITAEFSPSGGSSGHPVVSMYTTPGTYTWDKSSGTTYMAVYGCSGGAGGGSGARFPNRQSTGGSGGGYGGQFSTQFLASLIGSTATVVVGAGGVGGASVLTDNSAGNNGTLGGVSSFGSISNPGSGPVPGQGGIQFIYTAPSSGSQVLGGSNNGLSGSGYSTTQQTNVPSFDTFGYVGSGSSLDVYNGGFPGQGGGGNGATTTTPTGTSNPYAAGDGGRSGSVVGGAAGTILSPNGISGGNSVTGSSAGGISTFGSGGGGGFGQTASSLPGNGGNGGYPGGGGGGGGASLNGTASGSGGNGGNGIVVIIEW